MLLLLLLLLIIITHHTAHYGSWNLLGLYDMVVYGSVKNRHTCKTAKRESCRCHGGKSDNTVWGIGVTDHIERRVERGILCEWVCEKSTVLQLLCCARLGGFSLSHLTPCCNEANKHEWGSKCKIAQLDDLVADRRVAEADLAAASHNISVGPGGDFMMARSSSSLSLKDVYKC
ncbi:hypothetical protein QBC41DRAFT_113474 [Cercophora samala]|uniref:Uncharacterized protein n=1 Tax=Cercophora samala TaxID=330535 RepID=A0AA39ZDJ7_9PEZI|nr:hypothetical protein QBC41DRAFT_113474 [Cercophora samala]